MGVQRVYINPKNLVLQYPVKCKDRHWMTSDIQANNTKSQWILHTCINDVEIFFWEHHLPQEDLVYDTVHYFHQANWIELSWFQQQTLNLALPRAADKAWEETDGEFELDSRGSTESFDNAWAHESGDPKHTMVRSERKRRRLFSGHASSESPQVICLFANFLRTKSPFKDVALDTMTYGASEPRMCYNFSYPELLLFHIDLSLRSNHLWLSLDDIFTTLSVNPTADWLISFTHNPKLIAIYSLLITHLLQAQSVHPPFRLFFSWLLSFTDHDILCLTHNP